MRRPLPLGFLFFTGLLVEVFRAQAPAADAAATLFARDRILQIDLQMAPELWREVRLSHRTLNDVSISPESDDAYQYRPGEVQINGVPIGRIGVRKKGFLGSVVSTRPSLKLKFDEYVDGREFSGVDGLTLNNNNQDQALVQQFLAYDLYARAGVPAPRANFAHVRVNGEDLGIYTNVEPVGRRFLRRGFGNDSGVLYESYAGDFTAGRMSQIIEKSGDRNQDRSRLGRLRDLLASPDPLDLTRIDELVELDTFIGMWAVESLMGHWDSYSGNRNNYYVYAHPGSGKLHFIPWGADSVFEDPGPLQTKTVPKSFKAEGVLASRLWDLPVIRDRYRTMMRQLLAGPWTESRIVGEARDLQRTLQPRSTLRPETIARATDVIEAFVRQRRAEVEAELKEPAPAWPAATTAAPAAGPLVITGTFTAPWVASAPADPFAGAATMALQVAGRPTAAISRAGAFATTHTQDGAVIARIRERYQNVTLTGLSGTTVWQVSFTIDPFLFRSNTTLPIDLYEVWALIVTKEATSPARTNIFGARGELRLDEASSHAGGQVRGTFTLRAAAAP